MEPGGPAHDEPWPGRLVHGSYDARSERPLRMHMNGMCVTGRGGEV